MCVKFKTTKITENKQNKNKKYKKKYFLILKKVMKEKIDLREKLMKNYGWTKWVIAAYEEAMLKGWKVGDAYNSQFVFDGDVSCTTTCYEVKYKNTLRFCFVYLCVCMHILIYLANVI